MRLHEIELYRVYNDPIYKQYKTAIDYAINKYVTTGAAIYKGSKNYDREKLTVRDPMSFADPRRSRNTSNYYTEWVDNSPKWSQFPKRSRSLICTSDKVYASGYGQIAVVVPIVDTTVGVCPDNDWWNSFRKQSPRYTTADDVNGYVHEVLKSNDIFLNGRTVTYSQFIEPLKTADLKKAVIPPHELYGPLHKQALELGSLYALMDHIFDPAANEFSLTSWKQYSVIGEHEVWLSAPCVMVPMYTWTQLVNS